MSDKGGAIVIMNMDDYISVCEEVLRDNVFFLWRNKTRPDPLLQEKARRANSVMK